MTISTIDTAHVRARAQIKAYGLYNFFFMTTAPRHDCNYKTDMPEKRLDMRQMFAMYYLTQFLFFYMNAIDHRY